MFAQLRALAIAVVLSLTGAGAAGQDVPPGAPETPSIAPDKAYLFAHMKTGDYGTLYYSISKDGLHWTALNGGKPVSSDYHGHASIAQGPDSRYYLVGNRNDEDPYIRFWVSDDLVTWQRFGTYRPDLSDIPGHPHTLQRIGAPKLFFDKTSGSFLLSWHTPNQEGSAQDPERYWSSQRTLYVLSPDLRSFPNPPRRLFDWDMATIDTILLPNDARPGYCAFIKDERYPSYDWPTGKTIRTSCALALTGPYPPPGPPLSPNFREAPTVIRSPEDKAWFLYYEQYAGTSYGMSKGRTLEGPWYQVSGNSGVPEWNRYEMTPGARHGSMLSISAAQFDALVEAFGTNLPLFSPQSGRTFTNPLLASGPDPYVVREGDLYYYTHTTGDRIDLWKTKDITDLANAERQTVWRPTQGTPNSASIWAPELHRIDGKWYLYYTAVDSAHDDDAHRGIYVLENTSEDPLQGNWIDLGRVNTSYPGIDGTVFDFGGKRYFAYSPYVGPDSDIAIAEMADPVTLLQPEVIIATPDNRWERQGGRQILEGPAFLPSPSGDLYLAYSGSACWSDGYAVGLLEAREGADPLDAASWHKRPTPVIETTPEGHVFAPGHNAFFTSPSGETWTIYHANARAGMGCTSQRAPHLGKVSWSEGGVPLFAAPEAQVPSPVPR